jgi:hypothetical protein
VTFGTRKSAATLVALTLAVAFATGCGAIETNERPVCRFGGPTVLMAEAIPAAQMVPCVRSLPIGWHFGSFRAGNGDAAFTLDSDLAGKGALLVELSSRCTTEGAMPSASDESGAKLFRTPARSDGSAPAQGVSRLFKTPAPTEQWLYVYPGACVRYAFVLPAERATVLERQIRTGVSFVTRHALDRVMRDRTGRSLYVPGVGA